MKTTIVIETTCEHGHMLSHWVNVAEDNLCPGGNRRTIEADEVRDAVVSVLHDHGAVKAAPGNWVKVPDPSACPQTLAHFGTADRILGAIGLGGQ